MTRRVTKTIDIARILGGGGGGGGSSTKGANRLGKYFGIWIAISANNDFE